MTLLPLFTSAGDEEPPKQNRRFVIAGGHTIPLEGLRIAADQQLMQTDLWREERVGVELAHVLIDFAEASTDREEKLREHIADAKLDLNSAEAKLRSVELELMKLARSRALPVDASATLTRIATGIKDYLEKPK